MLAGVVRGLSGAPQPKPMKPPHKKPEESAGLSEYQDHEITEVSSLPDNIADDSGGTATDKLETKAPEMKLSKESESLDAPEGILDCADARVMEAENTPEFQEQVLALYSKHFNMTDTL